MRFLDFICFAPLLNDGYSSGTEIENRCQISDIVTPCTIRIRLGEMFESLYQAQPTTLPPI